MAGQDKKSEIDFFNRLAGAKSGGKDNYIAFILKKLKSLRINMSGKMLECGCGNGEMGKAFLREFSYLEFVYGVDLSPELVRQADSDNPSYMALIEDLEVREIFPKDYFQVILSNAVLHHFQDPKTVLENISYWLKPGGTFIVIEPNGLNIINQLGWLLRRILMVMFGKDFIIKRNIASPNDHCHIPGDYMMRVKEGMSVSYFEPLYFLEDVKGLFQLKVIMFKILNKLFPDKAFSSPMVLMIFKKEWKWGS